LDEIENLITYNVSLKKEMDENLTPLQLLMAAQACETTTTTAKNIVLLNALGSVSNKRSGWQSSLPTMPTKLSIIYLGIYLITLKVSQKQSKLLLLLACPGLLPWWQIPVLLRKCK
jgi:hypothetical protein